MKISQTINELQSRHENITIYAETNMNAIALPVLCTSELKTNYILGESSKCQKILNLRNSNLKTCSMPTKY